MTSLTLTHTALSFGVALTLLGCGVYDGGILTETLPLEYTEHSTLTAADGPADTEADAGAIPPAEALKPPLAAAPVAPVSLPSQSGSIAGDAHTPNTLAPTSNHRGGERLRARHLQTAEGYQSWQGWYDSELAEDCNFQRDAEGTLRCFPVSGSDQVSYSDAGCTQAYVTIETPCGEPAVPPRYVYRSEATVCGRGIRVYEPGVVWAAPAGRFILSSAGECLAAEPVAGLSFGLSDEVALENFVAGEFGTIGNGARLQSYGIVAEDGTSSVTGFIDTHLDVSCMWSAGSNPSCVPQSKRISHFAGATQNDPLIEEGTPTCSPAGSMVGVHVDNECTVTYFRGGEEFTGAEVYNQFGEVSSTQAEATRYFRTAEVLPQTQFARGELIRDQAASTRLTPVFWSGHEGGIWFSHWYDTTLDTDCNFSRGQQNPRCVPRDTSDRIVYADAACSEPLTETRRTDACGEAIQRPQFVREVAAAACSDSLLGVRRVLAKRSITTVYEKSNDGACLARPWTAGVYYYALGELIPASNLVHGTMVTE